MELRDTLSTTERYQEIIDFELETIDEDKSRIKERIEDERNGIKKFPKPNLEIVESIRKDLPDKYYEILAAKFSLGIPVNELENLYESYLTLSLHSWKAESGYVQIINLLSIGIMFEIDNEEFNKLVALVERDNVSDYLIDLLIRYRKPDWRQTEKFLWNKPYKGVSEIVALTEADKLKALVRLKKYLGEWYKSLETKTHESKWNIHTGYWCWEAGALVKILGLDDSSLKDQQYYPYDMVHWKD